MQRVLDRVRQLPILPGTTVDPELLSGIDFGQPPRAGHLRRHRSAVDMAAGEPNGPVVRPLLLILATAMSTIVVAMLATIITIDMAHREPSPKVRPAGAEQARTQDAPAIALRDRDAPNVSQPDLKAVVPGNGSVTALPAPEPDMPASEVTSAQELPQSGPQDREQLPQALLERERAAPQSEPQVREREHGQRRVPVASGERKREPATVRTIVQQSERTRGVEPQVRTGAVGVGDVLAGGL